jgi:aspartyl-tRNA(Asn)/glutamyl-tRNA(Gln) amidotransferase subunit A
MNLNKLTIHDLRKKLDSGEISSKDIVSDMISQIEKTDTKLNAYIDFNKNDLLNATNESKGILSGIPITIKDNICIQGKPAGCASKILDGFVSPYSATVIKKLQDSGAVFIPRANMDEFAMGSSTENSYYGPARNPSNTEMVPGGSSGGSAVAVAGNEAIAALGSDTGGSIRQPAALCGVVGLKPTYGRVSRYGLIAFASSLDQIGPITKDVTDSAILLNVISGHDTYDSTSANLPVPDYTKILGQDIKGLKIGIPKEYFIDGMDIEVKENINKSINKLENLGAKTIEISLPHTEYAVSVYYIIATAEASSNLAKFDGVQYGYRSENGKSLYEMYSKTRGEGFGAEVKRRIILGTYVLSAGYYDAYYLKAQQVRTLIKNDFDNAFNKVDIILTPTSPTPAFKIGEKTDDPLQMYLSDIYTISVNLSGLPAISVPCGLTKNSLPIGLQLIGKAFDEETILKAAYAYEQNRI